MKHFLLSFLLLTTLSSISDTLVAGDPNATRTLTKNYNELNYKINILRIIQTKLQAQTLLPVLENSTKFLIGDQDQRNQFIASNPEVQSLFIAAWAAAADTIITAAYGHKTINFYDKSYTLLDTSLDPSGRSGFIYVFFNIATTLNDPQVIAILQDYFKKDPRVIFKNMYRTLVYQWLMYTALMLAQESKARDLESYIDFGKQTLPIDTKDQELMNELEEERKILVTLLDPKAVGLVWLNDYLALVRDYMLGVVIPPMQLKPPIRIIPEDEARIIKHKNLEKLSKRPELQNLSEDNPLHKMVEQDLEQRQPELATPQALVGHLTNLSTQLAQLRASVAR